ASAAGDDVVVGRQRDWLWQNSASAGDDGGGGSAEADSSLGDFGIAGRIGGKRVAEDHVVAVVAIEEIIAHAADDKIIGRAATGVVIAVAGEDIVHARFAAKAVVAAVGVHIVQGVRDPVGEVGRHGVGSIAKEPVVTI